ncbi:MAG: Ig-like domain-containing protein, partial [Micrococcales bacterium]|nr:Ig-like domain-containing protein [Micrococcales bacterium]
MIGRAAPGARPAAPGRRAVTAGVATCAAMLAAVVVPASAAGAAAYEIDTMTMSADGSLVITGGIDTGQGNAADVDIVLSAGGQTVTACHALKPSSDGDWTCPADASTVAGLGLTPGAAVTVTVVKTDGNGSISSTTEQFTVAAGPPVITAPSASLLNRRDTAGGVTIAGTGWPGATVTVSDSAGDVLCEDVPVGADGAWTCPAQPLADGTYNLTATQTTGGAESARSAPVTFTVDAHVGTPTIAPTSVIAGAVAIAGTSADATIAAGDTVTVAIRDRTGTQVATCTATVAADGAWQCPALDTSAWADGRYTAVATETDAAGNRSARSNAVAFRLLSAPVITSPSDGALTNNPMPAIGGTGYPGATVAITVGDGSVPCLAAGGADVVVASDHTWSCTPTENLPDGDYQITAQQSIGGVDSADSAVVNITVDTQVDPPAITAATLTDLTTIAFDSTGSMLVNQNVTAIRGTTAESNSTVTVTIDGVAYQASAAGGLWSVDLSAAPLKEGTHSISAFQVDAAGNTSASVAASIAVDETALPPVIVGPANGLVTTRALEDVHGTGEPGAKVSVLLSLGGAPAAPLCTASVAPNGQWDCGVEPFATCLNTSDATETDQAGNV